MNSSLFPHQQRVLDNLLATAEVFFSRSWRSLPIAPRFSRLIVGPTGSGKTHLVRDLAGRLGLPIMELSASSWIPIGCSNRGANPTWPELAQFFFDHRRGVVFIDEVDKLFGWSEWVTCLRVEIFSLLDQRVLGNVQRPTSFMDGERALKVAKTRLRRSFFVIAAGAFQAVWDERGTPSIGFRVETESPQFEDPVEQNRLSKIIPREIINRFASPILTINPLRQDDYRRMLAAVLKKLPFNLRHHVQFLGEASLEYAVSNQLGCRWVEELILQVLIESKSGERKGPYGCKREKSLCLLHS